MCSFFLRGCQHCNTLIINFFTDLDFDITSAALGFFGGVDLYEIRLFFCVSRCCDNDRSYSNVDSIKEECPRARSVT